MHAPKELSTDAFLAWFFKELEVNPDIADYRSQVFHTLGLIAEGEIPVKIEPELQSGNVDSLLNFEANNTARRILFENKTSSTFHSDQLNRYRERFPNCDKYVYFKIGYVDTALLRAVDAVDVLREDLNGSEDGGRRNCVLTCCTASTGDGRVQGGIAQPSSRSV